MHFYPSGGRYRTLLNVLSIWYLFTVSFCEGIDAFVRAIQLPSDPLSNWNNQSFNSSVLILFEFLELIFCFFLQGHFVTSSALLVCVSFCRMCTFDLHPLQSCHQLIELLKSLLHLCNPSQHMMVNYLKSFHLTILDVLFPFPSPSASP